MKILFYLFTFILLIGCQPKEGENSEEKKIDPINAALPHGDTLAIQELSPSDKARLSEANGRSAELIDLQYIKDSFEEPFEGLVIYNFWNLGCAECLDLNEKLEKLILANEENSVAVVQISLDPKEDKGKVNSYIREKNILSSVLQLKEEGLPMDWQKELIPSWDGKLPATYLINTEEGINLFYQHNFNYDELEAVVQPLLL